MKFSFLIILGVLIASCHAAKQYTYHLAMERPAASETLSYEDDTMSVVFSFQSKFIGLDIYNKSDDGIKINWDEVSMSINGMAQRTLHKETSAYNITEIQAPTTIPPHTRLKDEIFPADKVRYTSSGGVRHVSIDDIYPNQDYGFKKNKEKIMSLKGERVVIYLPYYMRGEFRSKTFEFTIKDITAGK